MDSTRRRSLFIKSSTLDSLITSNVSLDTRISNRKRLGRFRSESVPGLKLLVKLCGAQGLEEAAVWRRQLRGVLARAQGETRGEGCRLTKTVFKQKLKRRHETATRSVKLAPCSSATRVVSAVARASVCVGCQVVIGAARSRPTCRCFSLN